MQGGFAEHGPHMLPGTEILKSQNEAEAWEKEKGLFAPWSLLCPLSCWPPSLRNAGRFTLMIPQGDGESYAHLKNEEHQSRNAMTGPAAIDKAESELMSPSLALWLYGYPSSCLLPAQELEGGMWWAGGSGRDLPDTRGLLLSPGLIPTPSGCEKHFTFSHPHKPQSQSSSSWKAVSAGLGWKVETL